MNVFQSYPSSCFNDPRLKMTLTDVLYLRALNSQNQVAPSSVSVSNLALQAELNRTAMVLRLQQLQQAQKVDALAQFSQRLPVKEVPNPLFLKKDSIQGLLERPENRETHSKSEVKQTLIFLLRTLGSDSDQELLKFKSLHSTDPAMNAMSSILIARYAATTKTKEEMVKYTLRKALKWLKNRLIKNGGTNGKCAAKLLIQKYFSSTLKEQVSDVDSNNEEAIIEKLLPFRKSSKNKTMNTSFVMELFASEEFTNDFKQFLEHFDDIMMIDNNKKIEKFVACLNECLMSNSLERIRNYKRIPWLQSWIKNTKNHAYDLLNFSKQKKQASIDEKSDKDSNEPSLLKKIKKEDLSAELRFSTDKSEVSTLDTQSSCNELGI